MPQNLLHRPRPLHHTSCGPPPRLTRGRMKQAIPFPRCTCIRVFVQAVRKLAPKARGATLFASLKREAERRMAHLETARHSRGAAPVSRYSRGPHYKGRSSFGAPLRIAETFISARPVPALPGIAGSTAVRASPTPVQQAPCSPITCRTGMMPRPSANSSDKPPPAEPALAPSVVVRGDVPHDERVVS
jgi:hypothetical protein